MFWAIIIICIIIFVVIFPYIDANFFFYSRIEKRLDNLQKLQEINGLAIDESPDLKAEYQSVLGEITQAREKTIIDNSQTSISKESDYWIKFISGGFIFALVGIIGLFKGKKGEKLTLFLFIKNNLFIFIFCEIIAVILGYIFTMIPTIGSIWVNAILSPIIQLIIVYLFMQPKKSSSS